MICDNGFYDGHQGSGDTAIGAYKFDKAEDEWT